MEHGIIVDDLGGDVLCVEISALQGKNVHELKVVTFLTPSFISILIPLIIIGMSDDYQEISMMIIKNYSGSNLATS